MLKKIKLVIPKFSVKRVIIALVLILAIGGAVWFRFLRPKKGVEKDIVKRGDVAESLVLSGEIEATLHAGLTFETSGQIEYVGVKEGEKVKKGQVLGQLDTTTLNSAYQQALATLRKYDATVDNVHDQIKNHSADETYAQKDTRTTAEVNKDYAYEAVLVAERNLKGATIKAPFEGVITYVANPFSGTFVIYTQKQFEMFDPETVYFKVSGDQTEVVRMKAGQEVGITLDSYPEEEISGRIKEISFAPDEGEVGVIYGVKVELVNSDVIYRLGMTGDATFVMNEAKNVLYVPPKFIKTDKETGKKYLQVNGGKKKVFVEVGIDGEDRVEVKGDIKEGETVYD